MCNHYREPVRKLGLQLEFWGFEEINDTPRDIYPRYFASVIRTHAGGGYEAIEMSWGFPPLDKPGAQVITNIRNLSSSYWRPWLKPEYRCLVPWVQFAEWPKGGKETWFETGNGQLAYFAGIWRPWHGDRGTKKAPNLGDHLLFAFATCEPNEIVAPVHPKAMPVIFTTDEECEAWLTASAGELATLQRPLDSARLRLVA